MPRTLSVPPVTGVGGSNGPYANLYDQSGFFRDRSGSQKRRRRDGQDELLDSVFDLTRDFPPTNPPPEAGPRRRLHQVDACGGDGDGRGTQTYH